jgi:hypothetical protein
MRPLFSIPRMMALKAVKVNRTGCTRTVILIGGWAIKIPNFMDGWFYGLKGLLANLQEIALSQAGWPELCPVKFSLPGGWLVLMPAAIEMTDDEFLHFDARYFCEKPGYVIPAEHKANSFGHLNGRIVVIDYGN